MQELQPGFKKNKLTVIRRVINLKNRAKKYLCLCDCGIQKEILGRVIILGLTKSCGCYSKDVKRASRMSATEYGVSKVLNNYKSKAKERNLEFSLNIEDFIELIGLECYYCGEKNTNCMKTWENEPKFYYNGIDRIDNLIGYTKNNCVACCKFCNFAKNTLSQEEFYSWIDKIYDSILKKPEFNHRIES